MVSNLGLGDQPYIFILIKKINLQKNPPFNIFTNQSLTSLKLHKCLLCLTTPPIKQVDVCLLCLAWTKHHTIAS